MTTTAQLWAATRDLTLRPAEDACTRPVMHLAATPDPDGTVRSRCRKAILNPNGPTRPAADVPEGDRCHAPGCRAAWPTRPIPPPTPAMLCTTIDCPALATHTATRSHLNGPDTTAVLCEWCALRYRHRHHAAVTLERLEAWGTALADAIPDGLYRISVGLLGDLRPAGVCNAAEARLRLAQARRDGYAVQVLPGGGFRAGSTAGGWVGEINDVIVLRPYRPPESTA